MSKSEKFIAKAREAWLGHHRPVEWGYSKGEQEVSEFITSLGFDDAGNVRGLMEDNREVDIYVPEKKVAFEYNGLFWHSEVYRDSKYHYNKHRDLHREGIRLIQIWEDDWKFRRPQVEEHIRQVLGVSDLPKVSARKTEVVRLTFSEAEEFLEEYHIQGVVNSSVYLGLTYQGELVAVASFRKRGEDYELTRYATSVSVRGGHSKLVSYMERNFEYGSLITFADLTFSDGNLYRVTGWLEDKVIPPDYSYVVGSNREHKFGYRKKRFKNDPTLLFEEGKTERELAQMNGLLRIYDAGKIRFTKPHPGNDTN